MVWALRALRRGKMFRKEGRTAWRERRDRRSALILPRVVPLQFFRRLLTGRASQGGSGLGGCPGASCGGGGGRKDGEITTDKMKLVEKHCLKMNKSSYFRFILEPRLFFTNKSVS